MGVPATESCFESYRKSNLSLSRLITAVAATVGLCLVLTACSRNASGEYVGNSTTSVVRLQLVETPDKHLSGQMDVAILKPDGTIVSETLKIAGTTDGNKLSLTASAPPVPLGPVFNLSGTIGWNSLDVTASGGNGLLKTVTLKPGNVDEYNTALSALQKKSASIRVARAEAQRREEQKKAEAQAYREKLNREVKEVQDKHALARRIQLLCDRMERFDKAASATLQRFPTIEAKYRTITSKVQKFFEHDQMLAGDSNASYTRSEIRYQMGNGLYATGQLHFEVQSLQSDFNNRIASEMKAVRTVKADCDSLAKDPILQPACQRFNSLYPTYAEVFAQVGHGLTKLEATYQTELEKQKSLQTAARHIN